MKLVLMVDKMYVICCERNMYQVTNEIARATIFETYSAALKKGSELRLDLYSIKDIEKPEQHW